MEMGLGLLILFYIFGLALIFGELFVPGGILGAAGFILVISSIGFSYNEFGSIVALPMFAVTIVFVPMIILHGISRLTHKEVLSATEGSSPFRIDLKELDGKEGVAISVLRPSGMVKIDNHRVDAVAENELIPKDALIKVIRVDGQRVVVRNLKV
ncbi:MAG: NfeD family protein [Planctomycetota bacterium]